MTRKARTLLGVGFLAAMSFAPARADVLPGGLILSGPSAKSTGYLTPVAFAFQGGVLTYVNADIEQHNVVSCHFTAGRKICDYGPDTQPWCFLFEDSGQTGLCPLFWSPLQSLGGTVQVLGLENTEAGKTYGFYCEPHGSAMTGTLVILPKAG